MADPLKAMTSLMMDKMLAHMSTEEIQAMMREMRCAFPDSPRD